MTPAASRDPCEIGQQCGLSGRIGGDELPGWFCMPEPVEAAAARRAGLKHAEPRNGLQAPLIDSLRIKSQM